MNKHERQNPLILAFWWLHMNEVHIQSYIKVKKKLLDRKITVNIQLNIALKNLNTFNLGFEVWIFVKDVHLLFPVKLVSPV